MNIRILFYLVFLLSFGSFSAATAFAATVIVPDDHATIQAAVTAVQNDADPGVVIINSDATFDESVQIFESVTLSAGSGFSPIIEKTSGSFAPLRIRALYDADTAVLVQGIEVRTQEPDGITVSNISSSNTLTVNLDNVTVNATECQSAVSVASATINANIFLTIIDSFIQIEGMSAGSPECLRLTPYAYNIHSTLRNNTFRFSNAGGISIMGGRDDKTVTTLVDASVFEGFTSTSGEGRVGVDISGTGNAGSDASPTVTYVTNSLFMNTQMAIEVNGQMQHTHTLYANNNTLVDSVYDGIGLVTYGDSTIVANTANNIIAGSGAFGIATQDSSTGVINLTNNYNLLFDNASGNYVGASAGADALAEDPLFTNPAAGNYRLQPASPAIDSGTNAPTGGVGFGFDLDGNARSQDDDGNGSVISNIGAYEEPEAAPSTPPVPPGAGSVSCFIKTAMSGIQ